MINGADGASPVCKALPSSLLESTWITLECNDGDGVIGNQIKIVGSASTSEHLQICGVKVYGTTALTSKSG